jgi:putative MATE family efflux protein
MAVRGRFLTGSTMGHVVRMTMAGAMGITFVFVVDAANLFWIAKLGDPTLLAAVGFAFAIQFFSVSSGIGLMIAATALISRSIGAGARETARQQATSAAILAALWQFSVAGIIILFRHDILALIGATGETAALAARYLAISLPSLGIMAVSLIANGALRAEGDGRRSMLVTLLSGVLAMVVDPFLIYGLGWGLDGAAIGLTIFRFAMLGLALRFAISTHYLMAPPSLASIRQVLVPFMVIAIPAMLTQLATPVGNFLATTVMAPYGDDAMAGWAVVGRLTVVAFGGIFSLAGAIGGIFGQNFGACRYDRVQSTYRNAILFGVIYTLVTWGILAGLGHRIAGSFELTPEGVRVVLAFTSIGAGGFVLGSALFVANSAFNALGKPTRSTLSNWFRDGILTLPLAILLAGWFGADGVIYAQAVAATLVGLVAAIWGWHHVVGLHRRNLPPLDLAPPRPYAHADRFRRR